MISYVNISQTQVSDSGLYRCTADNGLAQVSHQAQISVRGPIQVKPMPNVTVVASTSFRVRCPVAGFPVGELQWLHNRRRLPSNHRQHLYDNGTLEVEHMEKSQGDDGQYTCLAYVGPSSSQAGAPEVAGGRSGESIATAGGGASSSGGAVAAAYGSLFVSIKAKPTIEPFAISRSLREGQRASIMCTISSGDLPISITWFHNNQVMDFDQDDREAHRGQDATSADQQHQINNQRAGPSTAFEGQLLALTGSGTGTAAGTGMGSGGEPAPQVVSPRQMSASRSPHGAMARLTGVRLSRVSDYSSTLLFESLLAQHSGNYTCLARNEAGSVSHQAPMVVQGK